MKLEIFRFIDQSVEMLNREYSMYERAAYKLDRFFTDTLSWRDAFLNVSTRIKSEESLREKILRQNLSHRFSTPERMLRQLHDVIGIRIECRFIDEERLLYEALREIFTLEMDDGYFASSMNGSIWLDLNMEQPQTQKNGFEIYKIDGRIVEDGRPPLYFELQIKSMVNVFWGEIDHKVLYKNFNYIVTEEYFRGMLLSVKENLWMIDNRLMQIFRQYETIEAHQSNTAKDQLKGMFSKLVHDTYVQKMRESTGILFDFKKPSDLVVDFIFSKLQYLSDDEVANKFVQLLSRINALAKESIDFTEGLDVQEVTFQSPLADLLSREMTPLINTDFKWHALFRIILDLEETDFEDEFRRFIDYMISTFYYRIQRGMHPVYLSESDRAELSETLLEAVVNWYVGSCDLYALTLENMRKLERIVQTFLEDVKRPEDLWDLDPEKMNAMLEEGFVL